MFEVKTEFSRYKLLAKQTSNVIDSGNRQSCLQTAVIMFSLETFDTKDDQTHVTNNTTSLSND